MLDAMQASEMARSLYRVRGARAETDVEKRIADLDQAGKTSEAQNWRMIQAAISKMGAPKAS
ncbi:hypothetical protein ACN2XU_22130 [Primorskyibacter sp. 2E107]|uniref:hypothetical protein n=1 Tax=Primorskyibacter sp. 2E107 TaxID=3403458 RepID=UPI003AF4A0FE